MQKPAVHLIVGICTAAIVFMVLVDTMHVTNSKTGGESAYERVLRTGVLRCGYREQPGILEKTEDNKLTGIAFDYAQVLTKQAELKLAWVNTDHPTADLQDGKFDALCTPTKTTGRDINTHTQPIYYLPVYAYARDKRFDHHYDRFKLPAPTEASLDDVVNKQTEFALADVLTGQAYLKSHPGQLRQVAGPTLRLLPGGLTFTPEELLLKNLLDNATRELQLSGQLDRIFDRYETAQYLYRPAALYASTAATSERGIYTPPDEDTTDDVTDNANSAN